MTWKVGEGFIEEAASEKDLDRVGRMGISS